MQSVLSFANFTMNRIKDEFANDMPSNFDSVFDAFIQNTFVHKSDLQLAAYENQTKGEFFNHLADKNIPTNTANLIFQQLLNDVRKKSKEKIKVPIRMKRLVEKKGVDVTQIGRKIDGNIKNSGNYDEFNQYLLNQSLTEKDIRRIEVAKILHDLINGTRDTSLCEVPLGCRFFCCQKNLEKRRFYVAFLITHHMRGGGRLRRNPA